MMGWSLAAVPFLIALNAFFVAAEYAIVAIRPPQIAAMAEGRWRKSARAMSRLKENPGSAIGAVQVCITMTNLMLGWIGEPAMSAVLLWLFRPLADVIPATAFQTGSFVLSFVIVTLLTVVFSELLPKALTLRYVAVAAMLTAVPVLVLGKVTRPLVWLMNKMANAVTVPLGLGSVDEIENENVTVGELRLMARQAGQQGALTDQSKSLVLNSLAIAERRAKQIMVPRTKVTFLDLRRSMDENRQVMNDYLFTRLPLCDGGMDRVIGIVPVKEFLSAYNEEADASVLSLIAHPPVFAPENVALDRLLIVFKEHHTQLVLLVDEYGGVSGLVTLQDVVDELVGEIREAQEQLSAAPAGATGPPEADGEASRPLVVTGGTPVHELGRALNRSGWGQATTVATLNGLITAHFQRIPRPGDQLEVDGVRLRVRSVDRQVAAEVEVEAITPMPEALAEAV